MTKSQGIFVRLAHAIFAPDPSDESLTTLARSKIAPSVTPIEKSGWKLGLVFFGLFLHLCVAFAFVVGPWESRIWQAVFVLMWTLPAFFAWRQILPVLFCKKALLVLDAEGIRVNFTGDTIRYDQIADVEYSYLYFAVMSLRLAPGVILKSGRAYGVGERLKFVGVYAVTISDLAGEIERRVKITASKSSLSR